MITTDPIVERLKDLISHCEHVRENCETIGIHLIERGEFELGRDLILRGRVHDASKFSGIEWDSLGSDHPEAHRAAWLHHVNLSEHHPEHWGRGGVHVMDRLSVAEMVADWAGRSAEFGTDLRDWIRDEAMGRYGFTRDDAVFGVIQGFLDMLLKKRFQ